MGDGDTPPPRPTRPLNYVVTEFLDDSGPPKMPPRPNNGVAAADPPRRGPPPPIPSYRQHMDAKNEEMYIEVSPVKDSGGGNRKPADKESKVAPPPVSRDQTPVAPPRRKTISGRIPRTTEASPSAAKEGEVKQVDSQALTPAKGTESTQPRSTPSRPSAPLRPQQSLPVMPIAPSTKATPPHPSGTIHPQSQTFQRDPPPRARASTIARDRPSSQQAEGQGNVFSNLFKRKTTKKAKPVITVVEARPIDSETTPSPTMTTPTSLPPTQLHDDQKSPGSEAVKKPDRPVRAQVPSRPTPSTGGSGTGAEETNKPDLSAGTQVKHETPTVSPRTQTTSQSKTSSNPSATGEDTTSEMTSVKQQLLSNEAAAAGEQGLQPSPVPKPRNRRKNPSAVSDAPKEAQDVSVDVAVKGESEKDGTQQPAKARPPPPSRPRASTLGTKQRPGPSSPVKLEEPVIKADVPPPSLDAAGSKEQSIHAVEAPPQVALKQEQPNQAEMSVKAPPKPGPPGRPRPPAPAKPPSKGAVVESSTSPGSGEAAKSIDAVQHTPEIDAIYAVPKKSSVRKEVEPTVASEELENAPKDVAAVEKTPSQDGHKVEESTKVSSPKRKAPPKPAPPSRAKAPAPVTPLTKAVVDTKQEVPTMKKEGDAGPEKKATGESSNDKEAGQLLAVDGEKNGDGAMNVTVLAEASVKETVKVTPPDPTAADVDAIYAVPKKSSVRKEVESTVASEKLENAPKDVAAVENAPSWDGPKVEELAKGSPKRKAPPKPAPPSRVKAPTTTTPLTKVAVETKHDDADSEKKATSFQADMPVTVLPPEAPKPEVGEDKEENSATGSKVEKVEHPSKSSETAVQESPKNQPPKPKPPPPSRPRLPTLEKKQESVRVETSTDKETSQLDAAQLQDGRKETEADGEGAALKAEKTAMAAEVVKDRPSKPGPPNKPKPPMKAKPSLDSDSPEIQVAPSSAQSGLGAEKEEDRTSDVVDTSSAQPVATGRDDSGGGDSAPSVTNASTAAVSKEEPIPKVKESTKMSSPKTKPPPKPAPPSRPKAPAPTTPLTKAVVETKQEVPIAKEEVSASLERTADAPEVEAPVTVLPPEAPEPNLSEDMVVQMSAGVNKEEIVNQPSKGDDASQGTPRKVPSKPPPPSRPRLPTLEKKQATAVRADKNSVKNKDATAPLDEKVAKDQTVHATPKEEKGGASAETAEVPKTDASSVHPVTSLVGDSNKGLQQQGASVEVSAEETKLRDETTVLPKGVETVEEPGQESPKVEEPSNVSSPKRKAPSKPAPPSRAKSPAATPLMKAFVETRQKVSTEKDKSGTGSEKETPEPISEARPTSTLDEADVPNTSAAERPEALDTSMGGEEQGETHADVKVLPEAQVKKKAPPKPGPPSKPKPPAPARPLMKSAETSEPSKDVPTSVGSSEVTSSSRPDQQHEPLPASDAANPSLTSEPEVIHTSPLDTVTSPSSKKPPPKPGPPNRPKPPSLTEVKATSGEEQKQEPAQDTPTETVKGSTDAVVVPKEDTVLTVSQTGSSVEGEVTGTSEPAEMSTQAEVEASSPSSPLTTESGRPDKGSDTAEEHPPPPSPNDVITTPTNPTSGDGGGGKPAKPPPPGGSRPPPPSGDKRRPPPPKKPPPAKGPPPPKPKHPGPQRHHGNVPPPLPARPKLGHMLYYYVSTEPRAVAKYNFTAQLPGELSFDEGDVLEIVSREDLDWFICRNVMDHIALPEGLVHQRHLKIVKKLPGEAQSYGEGGPCAVAMSEFKAEAFNELSLKNGDLVYLDSRVDPHWFRGHLENGMSGIFPKDVVEIVEDLPKGPMECEMQQHPAPTVPTPSGPHCVVEFPFEAAGPGELSLSKGEVVELLERVGDNWFKGRLAGIEGIFPTNFVNVVVDLPPGGGAGGGVDTPTLGPNMAAAVADFDGMEGELSFKVGDHITVTGRVDDDWLEGTLQGQKGMFPASFIDRVPSGLSQVGMEEKEVPSVQQSAADSKPAKTGKCKALHKFETDIDGELPLNQGDIIVTTAWINEEWLSGKSGDKEGIFPLSFVEVLDELPRSTVEASKHHHKVTLGDDLMPKGKVLYDFTPETDEEIPLKAGETVLLLQKVDEAWYNGENSAGNFGNFPADYIQVIVPLP